MKALERRLADLEGGRSDYLSLSETLDRLDTAVEDGRHPDPRLVAALDGIAG